jgi:hypothetical protein
MSEPVDDESLLASIGLRVSGEDLSQLRAATMRVARHISIAHRKMVGFVPADVHVGVPPVAIHLGLALVELTGATVAVVDANVRYPGLGGLTRHRTPESQNSVFSTLWLRGSLALLTPMRVERAGEVLPQLQRLVSEGGDLFQHILVDLTGFEVLGEHASAAASMDAVIVLGRAHRSKESEMLALARSMPPERFLGVMLVG